MKILALTNLFPTAWDPHRASFNRQQFDRLAQHHDLEVLVAVDFRSRWRGPVGQPPELRHARTSDFTFWYPPKVGRPLHGLAWYASLLAQHGARLRRERYDLLLASWGFPDAVGTRWLARKLGLPYVVKVHGSDLNVQANHRTHRFQIAKALRDAQAVVAVSAALAGKARELGVPPDRVHVLYNGVDTSLFQPGDRDQARRTLDLPPGRRVVLYVGNLKVEKGCVDLLEAFPAVRRELPDSHLVIVGAGAARAQLVQRIEQLELGEYVTLAGAQSHSRLPQWMQAADLLCLPSHNEGVPNVVLEAMASGLPVVASNVGGIPEVLPDTAGVLVPPRDIDALAKAIVVALPRAWSTQAITDHASRFTWADNIQRLDAILGSAVQTYGNH